MISLVVLFPMVFVSLAMNIFMAMLMAFSAVITLVMVAFVGALTAYASAFLAIMIMLFS